MYPSNECFHQFLNYTNPTVQQYILGERQSYNRKNTSNFLFRNFLISYFKIYCLKGGHPEAKRMPAIFPTCKILSSFHCWCTSGDENLNQYRQLYSYRRHCIFQYVWICLRNKTIYSRVCYRIMLIIKTKHYNIFPTEYHSMSSQYKTHYKQ